MDRITIDRTTYQMMHECMTWLDMVLAESSAGRVDIKTRENARRILTETRAALKAEGVHATA